MIKTIIALAGLALSGGLFFMYTQPTYDLIRERESQIDQYDQALQRATELQNIKQSLLSRYNAFNPADLDRLQKLLPDHVDNVRLVLDLDNLGARHGMALQNVVVSVPTNGGGEERGASIVSGGKQAFDSVTLRFSTVGTYENFRAFMDDLEMSLRIVDLVSLQLQRANAQILDKNVGPTFSYDVTVRTYWLK